MILPEVIAYLLTLRYPGSGTERGNYVCYRGVIQTLIPALPSGRTVNFTFKPLYGSFAWIVWASRVGTDAVPNCFTGSVVQSGSQPYSGLVTQRGRDDPAEYLAIVTEQEPAYLTITNISPLQQRWETMADFLVIPTQPDMVIVFDALRRLHTSQESEHLLQQAASLLGEIAEHPLEPKPPVGGN